MVALSFLQTVELVKHARLTKVPGSGDAMRREWYNILIKRQGLPPTWAKNETCDNFNPLSDLYCKKLNF